MNITKYFSIRPGFSRIRKRNPDFPGAGESELFRANGISSWGFGGLILDATGTYAIFHPQSEISLLGEAFPPLGALDAAADAEKSNSNG